MQKLSQREKVKYWRGHVSRFVASNKTQKQYCRENDISHTKFKNWRYKFLKEFPSNQEILIKKASKPNNKTFATLTDGTTTRKFAAVKIIDDVSNKQSKGQITKLYLNKDIYLELPIELEIKDLQKLFQALGIIAC